jgi:hypothetical protein
VQAVVHGVVEFPEPHDAGELDDLRRRQVPLEALQQLVRHRCRSLGSGPHVVETGALELVLGCNVAGDHLLQLFLAHAPSFGAALGRLL